jgi:DNA-binding XRE family transcriptional regulator
MPRNNDYPYPNELRRFRHQRGMRLVDVARKTGHVNLCQIVAWEKGKKLPCLRNAIKLACALKVPVEVLFLQLTHEIRKQMSEQRRE